MRRFSLAGALWIVALIALGFAALRNASNFWLEATFLIAIGLLCASVRGAVLERDRDGSWWLWFALFGWAYLAAGMLPPLEDAARMPSRWLFQWIFVAANGDAYTGPISVGQLPYHRRMDNAIEIGHWIFILIFARAGAMVSYLFTKGLPWRRRPAQGGARRGGRPGHADRQAAQGRPSSDSGSHPVA